ncbi:uncharacterized protein LOC133824766 [Humulus lupulus]|uniref:uncharacterized protein LOC133824766 n=1 Tax=Humulus lupulus TaxID=3486 RepID=UPI002B40059E|nr:uncharacterized protein LOC133824766 [Humulus lupulus]
MSYAQEVKDFQLKLKDEYKAVKSKLEAEVKEMSSRVEELEKLNAELEEAKNKLKEKSSMVEELNAKLEEEKKATFEIMEGKKAHLLEEFKERKDRTVDLVMYRIWASNADLDTNFLGSFEDKLIAKWKPFGLAMATNDPNIPEEEILDEAKYPQRLGKHPMENSDPDERSVELEDRQLRKQLAEAKKCNEELVRLSAEAQAAQAPPSPDTQALPPRDIHVPSRRPRGRPQKNAATRRGEKPPPLAEQPAPPRTRMRNRAEDPPNPTVEALAEISTVKEQMGMTFIKTSTNRAQQRVKRHSESKQVIPSKQLSINYLP